MYPFTRYSDIAVIAHNNNNNNNINRKIILFLTANIFNYNLTPDVRKYWLLKREKFPIIIIISAENDRIININLLE